MSLPILVLAMVGGFALAERIGDRRCRVIQRSLAAVPVRDFASVGIQDTVAVYKAVRG